MEEAIQYFWREILLKEEAWAWSIIGLIFAALTLFARSVVFNPISKKRSLISSQNQKDVNSKYFTKSFAGWLFYIASLFGFIWFWQQTVHGELEFSRAAFLLASVFIAFLLSIMFHLTAYSAAALEQIRALEDKQLTS